MYKFFRKYQKVFIIFIAAIIIVVFTFFGTYNRGMNFSKKRDKKIANSMDEKPIFLSEIEKISWFLSFEEAFFSETVFQEFIDTGIAKELFEKYFEKLKGDFEKRFKRIKNYTPYVHPQASFISAKNVWKKYKLKTSELLEDLQKKEKFDLEAFEILLKLYSEQKKFPSNSLKNILLREQHQYKAMQDIRLFKDDFFLFGFTNVLDWFGKNFIDLISQFIINGSRLSESQGFSVNFNEAKLELLKRVRDKKILQKNEKTFVNIFKKIYIFQKYLKSIEDNVFVDNLCHNEIFSFFSENAEIKLFSLPNYLMFENREEFYKLLFYLRKTTKEIFPYLPSSYKNIEEIEKEAPSFVERKFVLNVKHVNKGDIGLKIGEKKLWDWQVEDKNFEKLKNRFFEISSKECGKTKEDRFFLLEELDGKRRAGIDEYSRNQMIEESSIKKELKEKREEKLEVFLKGVFDKNSKSILEGVDNKRLFSLLKKGSSKELLFYTDDEKNYYSISIQEKSKKFLESFKKVKEDGSLDLLFIKFLYEKYLASKDLEEVRGREFFEARDFLGFLAFFDVLEKIEKNPREENIKSYASNFLLSHVKKMRKDLLDGKLLEKGDWDLDVKDIVVTRKNPSYWMKKEIFIEKPSLFSKINVDGKNLSFFKLIEKKKCNKAPFEEIEKTKKFLGREAKLNFLKKVVADLKKENIVIPIEY